MQALVAHFPACFLRLRPPGILPTMRSPLLSLLLQSLAPQLTLDFLWLLHYYPVLLPPLILGLLTVLERLQAPLLHVPHPVHEQSHSQSLPKLPHNATPHH